MRHPQAENSVAVLQLFNALPGSLAISVDDIVKAAHPPAEMSVLALQSSRGAACVACRREAAGPSEQPQGRVRHRPPTQRASPGAMPARTGRPQRMSSL